VNMQHTIIQGGDEGELDRPQKGTYRCQWCSSVFDCVPREPNELYQMRAILMIPDCPDPIICDSCLQMVVTSYNPQATIPGTSNSGPSNLVLRSA
jgi:hypothetical protein